MAEWESEIDEGELEKLEWEVKEMAKKLTEYRKTLRDHLSNTNLDSGSDPLPSSSQRLPILPPERQAPPPPPPPPLRLVGSEEQECEQQKMIQLKELVSRNAENIPKAIKRAREATQKLSDSLEDGTRRTLHPAFTRRTIINY